METIALEHERDLTNSSVERITIPSATVLLHFIAEEMVKVLTGLTVDVERATRNLNMGGGRQMAERVMIRLADSLGTCYSGHDTRPRGKGRGWKTGHGEW